MPQLSVWLRAGAPRKLSHVFGIGSRILHVSETVVEHEPSVVDRDERGPRGGAAEINFPELPVVHRILLVAHEVVQGHSIRVFTDACTHSGTSTRSHGCFSFRAFTGFQWTPTLHVIS